MRIARFAPSLSQTGSAVVRDSMHDDITHIYEMCTFSKYPEAYLGYKYVHFQEINSVLGLLLKFVFSSYPRVTSS